MIILGLVSWWYSAGWLGLGQRLLERVLGTADFFSIGLLLKTLFSPYRQISAGERAEGPIGMQLRAWFDRQISRVIGAMVRLFVILFGLVATIVVIIASILIFLSWPLLPIAPLIAILFAGRLS